jgi:glycosyltransferase involved in cell wall biosynthesis
MKTKALVSINIRTFNSGKTLTETLDSVKNQTYPNTEVLIADAYSTDDTVRIAKKYKTTVHFAAKLGDARQENYRRSKGTYIFSVDSDQILDKNLVSECVSMCERGYDALIISERSVVRKGTVLEKLIAYDKWLIDKTLATDPVHGAACPRFFKKSILAKAKWKKSLSIFDDTILYAKLIEQGGKIGYIQSSHIYHYEVTSWAQLCRKFYRYGKGYVQALSELPLTVSNHSLPRRAYFTMQALSKPHYLLGLFLLYVIKATAAGLGMVSTIDEVFRKKFI